MREASPPPSRVQTNMARMPWLNPKLARKKAKLHRIIRKGFAPAGDKQSLRQAAAEAIQGHAIKRLPMRSADKAVR